MAIYFVCISFVALQCGFFQDKKIGLRLNSKEHGGNISLMLAFIDILLLAGLRGYSVGADLNNYLGSLEYYKGITFKEIFTARMVYPFDYEFGYFLFTKICAYLNFSKTVFFFVLGTIVYLPTFKYISRISSNYFISILVYFAFGILDNSFGLYRQMIATSFILSALPMIKERRMWRYIAMIIFACLFHTTAVLALVLYFMYDINWKKYTWIILTVEAVLLILGRYVILLVVKIFPMYAGYLGSKYDIQGGSYLNLLLLNLCFIFFPIRKSGEKGNIQKNDDDRVAICQLVVALMCQCLGYSLAIFGRIVAEYSICLLYVIPEIVKIRFKRTSYRIACAAVVVVLLALMYMRYSGGSRIVPYTFFWQ